MPQPNRWIICTKWASVDTEATNLAAKNMPPQDADSKEPPKHPEVVLNYFWSPVGSRHLYKKKSSIRGVPLSYDTEDEAIKGLQDIVDKQPELKRQNLKFSVLEVRYVPNKIKTYKKDWHDKYVKKEVELELTDHKFIDTMK